MKEILVSGINSTNSLYLKNGKKNAYRDAFHTGLGASRKEITWNKKQHVHICCVSKVPWRHKATCKIATRNAPDDLSDLTTPINK